MAATCSLSREPLAGAASRVPTDWQVIDWHQAHRNVRRLQARIVKATQEGRWGKMKALQHLLTHSRERQSARRATGDGKPGQTDARSGRNHLGYTRTES